MKVQVRRSLSLLVARVSALCATCLVVGSFPNAAFAVTNGNYTTTVALIQWLHSDCLLFTLTGVTTADSNVSSSQWFAIPGTQPDYAQVYALLLTAKTSGGNVNVITTGSAVGGACGAYVGVSAVTLQ